MSEFLVSVILCVRDGEKYLREALDSVANQGVRNLQVIVVDDGSTDDSAKVAEGHHIRPRIVSQPALGIGAALNSGMQVARGRFLAFIDCDDVWPRGRLAAMLSEAEIADIDFVYGLVVNTDEDLEPISLPMPARLAGAMLIKATSAQRVGELRVDVAHGAFVDWCGRAALLGLKFRVLDEIVLLRRVHDGNMGVRDRPRARADLLSVVREHIKRTRQ